ncbi:DUF305 domain-containing protein [Micromonospora sp. NBC_01813]|uniref:DUF305 domain-containing protein n=1 Tax=Micromonospora sp. NBC_01813 TaxID=2975988 RepID=UPI002DDA28C1|nr:DUF305 domain-containing protein [Micromonospora sp. NBC_01813]WSA08799.1 DUF305 domain-containing protein [Micromonospora sp. NBC_01813]
MSDTGHDRPADPQPPTEPPTADGPPTARPSRGTGFGTAWLAAAVVIGLLLGYAAGLLTPGLFTPGEDSPEAGFARDMSTHHAQAVELSMIALERSGNPAVRTLASDIALTQQGQIGVMQTWLREWSLQPTGTEPRMAWMQTSGEWAIVDGLMPGMATDAERAELREASGVDVDRLYLSLMLTHHLGGIHMADGVLELSDDENVHWLAESMVSGQQKEIELIRTLQSQVGG